MKKSSVKPRYLRKVDGTYVCRDDGQQVTSHSAHIAQWHSLSPRPNIDGLSGESQLSLAANWAPLSEHGWASHGPMGVDAWEAGL